jgi:ketosteroid isomerase-like protein
VTHSRRTQITRDSYQAFAKADHDFFDEHLIGWETE